jgi:recombination protein RecA
MLSPVRTARELSPVRLPSPLVDPFPGRLVELSGGPGTARLTTAASVVRRAQLAGETSVWIAPEGAALFPPDLDEVGVDLGALLFVRVPAPAGSGGLFRAAAMLLGSGAFGVLVLDLRSGPARIPPAVQGRLLGSARDHASRVLFLTEKSAGTESLGSLVGVRVEPRRVRVGAGMYVVETRVLKNKLGLPLDDPLEHRRGPWGLG